MVEYFTPEKDIDYGTPDKTRGATPSTQMVELTIDGWPVKVPEGTSVMRLQPRLMSVFLSSAPLTALMLLAPAAFALSKLRV